jgi:drug/metabolite transporter (DMT)-like permease
MKKYQANLLLLLVSVIWGGGFIFVEILLDIGMSAGMITMIRGLIFAICTFVLYFKHIIKMNKTDLKVGLLAGSTNALGFIIQAIGQSLTTPSHASLITSLNVVFVPFVCWIFYKNRPSVKSVIAAITCAIGAFLLVNNFSMDDVGTSLLGDALVLISAVMFAINYAILGSGDKTTHYGVVSFFMGVTMFVFSSVYVLISGQTSMPPAENTVELILCILYLGVLSSTLCQVLQVLCQRYTSVVSASLILMLEGFFGSVFALFYGDTLTWNLIVGGIIIILSLVFQEMDFSIFKKQKNNE